jgi:hypothetical protein
MYSTRLGYKLGFKVFCLENEIVVIWKRYTGVKFILILLSIWRGHAMAKSVEALLYMPAYREFDSRCCHWNFYRLNPSGRTMALGSTQPLKGMSTRNIFGKGGR